MQNSRPSRDPEEIIKRAIAFIKIARKMETQHPKLAGLSEILVDLYHAGHYDDVARIAKTQIIRQKESRV